MYSINTKVKMTKNAVENYGKEYQNVMFKVVQWYDHYTPTTNPNWQKDIHGHPGYDSGVGSKLYELETLDGEFFGNALYSYELTLA